MLSVFALGLKLQRGIENFNFAESLSEVMSMIGKKINVAIYLKSKISGVPLSRLWHDIIQFTDNS